MDGGGEAGGTSDGDNEVSTGPRASKHPDQHGQPDIFIVESRIMDGGRKAGGTSSGDDEVSLGPERPEHPDTLNSLVNLASIYRNRRRWTGAEKVEVQVMKTRKSVLGEYYFYSGPHMAWPARHQHTEVSSQYWVRIFKHLDHHRQPAIYILWSATMDGDAKAGGASNVRASFHPDQHHQPGVLCQNRVQQTETEKLEVRVMDTRTSVLGRSIQTP
jgi:Tetratricopeptide repeat